MTSTLSRAHADRVLDVEHATSACSRRPRSRSRSFSESTSRRRRGRSEDRTTDGVEEEVRMSAGQQPLKRSLSGGGSALNNVAEAQQPPTSAGNTNGKNKESKASGGGGGGGGTAPPPPAAAATGPNDLNSGVDVPPPPPPPYRGVLVGLRVLKSFDGEGTGVAVFKSPTAKRSKVVDSALFLGTVVDYRAPSIASGGRRIVLPEQQAVDGDNGSVDGDEEDSVAPLDHGLYRVVFDDGDVQDMEPEEVYDCADLYHVQRENLLAGEDAATIIKGKKKRSQKSSSGGGLFIGTDQRNKGSTRARANLKDGEFELLRHANQTLPAADLMALDEERVGYWLEYQSFNVKRGVGRPLRLVDVRGVDAGWLQEILRTEDGEDGDESKKKNSAKDSDEPSLPDPERAAEDSAPQADADANADPQDEPTIITPSVEKRGMINNNCDGMPEPPLTCAQRDAPAKDSEVAVELTEERDEEKKPEEGGRIPAVKESPLEPTSLSHPGGGDAEEKDLDPGEPRPVLEGEQRISADSVQVFVSDDDTRIDTSPTVSPAYDPVVESPHDMDEEDNNGEPKADNTTTTVDPGMDLKENGSEAPLASDAARTCDEDDTGATGSKSDKDAVERDDGADDEEEEEARSEEARSEENTSLNGSSSNSKIVSDDELSMKHGKKGASSGDDAASSTLSPRDGEEGGEDKAARGGEPTLHGDESEESKKASSKKGRPKKHVVATMNAGGFSNLLSSPGAERKRRTKKPKAGRARFPVLPMTRKVSIPTDSGPCKLEGKEVDTSPSSNSTLMPRLEGGVDEDENVSGERGNAMASVAAKRQKLSRDSTDTPIKDDLEEEISPPKESTEIGSSADRKRMREKFCSMKPTFGWRADSETETELDSDAEASLREVKSPSNKRFCHEDEGTTLVHGNRFEKQSSSTSSEPQHRYEKQSSSTSSKPQHLEKASNSSGSPVSVEMFDDLHSGTTTRSDEVEPLKFEPDAVMKTDSIMEGSLSVLENRNHPNTSAQVFKNDHIVPEDESKLEDILPTEELTSAHSITSHSTLSRHYDLGPGPSCAKPHIHVLLSAVVAEESSSMSLGTAEKSQEKKKAAASKHWKSSNFLEEEQHTSIAAPSPCMKKCQAAVSRFINPEYSYKKIIVRDHHFSSLPNISHLAECLAKRFDLPLDDWSARFDLILSQQRQGREHWPVQPSKDEMSAICVLVGLPGVDGPFTPTKLPMIPFQSGGVVEIVRGDLKGKRGIVKWVMNDKVSLLVYQNGAQVQRLFDAHDVRALSESDIVKTLLLEDGTNKQPQEGTGQDSLDDIEANALSSLLGESTSGGAGTASGVDDFFDEFVSDLFDTGDSNHASTSEHGDVESDVAKGKDGSSGACLQDGDFFSGLDHMLTEEVPELEDIFTILEKEVSVSDGKIGSVEGLPKNTKGHTPRKGKKEGKEKAPPKKKRGRPRKSTNIWGDLGEAMPRTVRELKDCLRELGCKSTGSKFELTKRLHGAYVKLDNGEPVGRKMRRSLHT